MPCHRGMLNPVAVSSLSAQILSKPQASILHLDDDSKYELSILKLEKLPGSTIDILVVADKDLEQHDAAEHKFRIECILHSKFLPLLNRGLFSVQRGQKQCPVFVKLAGLLQVEIVNGSLSSLLPTVNMIFDLPAGREQFVAVLGRDPLVPLVDLSDYARQPPGFLHQIGIWVKIVGIQPQDPQRLHRAVLVHDASLREPVQVIFHQSQSPLVGTVEVGGYLGLWYPQVSFDGIKVKLEVSLATVMFYAGLEVSVRWISFDSRGPTLASGWRRPKIRHSGCRG